jgi:hypothetical protein
VSRANIGLASDDHCVVMGMISRITVPTMSQAARAALGGPGMERSVARRWQMRAPRSWPPRMMGMGVESGLET